MTEPEVETGAEGGARRQVAAIKPHHARHMVGFERFLFRAVSVRSVGWFSTRAMRGLASLAVVSFVLVGCAPLGHREPMTVRPASTGGPSAALIARGAYLARAANCVGCHTAPGGRLLAGGVTLDTPYGVFVTPNITPDRRTGVGAWSRADFGRLMRDGVRPDGSYAFPAMPFDFYTRMTSADLDAIWAYLQAQPPANAVTDAHRLAFPFSWRPALGYWRAVHFRPRQLVARANRTAMWNRGAYLVEAVLHCAACHSPRDSLGGLIDAARYTGGPVGDAVAPDISGRGGSATEGWTAETMFSALRAGRGDAAQPATLMARVRRDSLDALTDDDLRAVADYLAMRE